MNLLAKIEKVLFRKPDNGWCILKTDKGVAKGVVGFEISLGDEVDFDGEWKFSAYSGGNEFVFSSCMMSIPEDSRSLLRYAVSITKGLGDAKEAAIWERYGEAWQGAEALDIPGLREDVGFLWQETLRWIREQRAMAKTVAWLMGKKCSQNMALKAWDKWGENTFTVIGANPFMLADLPNYGFCHVDGEIRDAFEIGLNDDRRIEAGILYAAGKLTDGGSTAFRNSELGNEVGKILVNLDEGPFDDLVGKMMASGRFDEMVAGLVVAGEFRWVGIGCYALAKDFENERVIFERFVA